MTTKNLQTKKFIKHIMERDYANAKSSLQTIVNEKMKNKINTMYKDLQEKK